MSFERAGSGRTWVLAVCSMGSRTGGESLGDEIDVDGLVEAMWLLLMATFARYDC